MDVIFELVLADENGFGRVVGVDKGVSEAAIGGSVFLIEFGSACFYYLCGVVGLLEVVVGAAVYFGGRHVFDGVVEIVEHKIVRIFVAGACYPEGAGVAFDRGLYFFDEGYAAVAFYQCEVGVGADEACFGDPVFGFRKDADVVGKVFEQVVDVADDLISVRPVSCFVVIHSRIVAVHVFAGGE